MSVNQVPLLEIHFQSAMAPASGIRVFPDGNYDHKSGDEDWAKVWKFTQAELEDLEEAILESGFFQLPETIAPDTLFFDGTIATWTIHLNNKSHQVRLEPGASVTELDDLYRTFTGLRKTKPEKSSWVVSLPDGRMKEFLITGSVNAVLDLRPLIAAMFQPDVKQNDIQEFEEDSKLLLKITWYSDASIQITEYYSDGKYVRSSNDERVEEKQLDHYQVLKLMKALSSIDWEDFPAHLDTTTNQPGK